MSCAFVLAIPNVAVVCTDTRINFTQKDGTKSVNDAGDLTISFQDGRFISFRSEERKNKSFAGGWAAGIGQFLIVHSCLSQLGKSNARTPTTVNAQIQRTYDNSIGHIKQQFPEDLNINRTAIIYVYQTKGGFKLSGISFTEDIVIPSDGDFFLATPAELPPEDLINTRNILRSIAPPTNMDGIAALVKQISAAFHHVYLKSSTVSDIIDMIILIRTNKNTVIQRKILAQNLLLEHLDLIQLLS